MAFEALTVYVGECEHYDWIIRWDRRTVSVDGDLCIDFCIVGFLWRYGISHPRALETFNLNVILSRDQYSIMVGVRESKRRQGHELSRRFVGCQR